MKRSPSLALVASGPPRHNLVARLPRLAHLLGPVKAPSLRTASRIANSLRAGSAAREWKDLAGADIILITMPSPRMFARTVAEMAHLPEFWRGKIVVATDTQHARHALAPLVCQGAIPASLLSLDTVPPAFILDTDRKTGARLRRLIQEAGGLTIEASEQAYGAVASLTHQNLPVLFHNAMTVLRQSGLESGVARKLMEVHFHQALRNYLRAGRMPVPRRPWQAPVGIPAD